MEDIKALFDETSELASNIGDLTIAWAKKNGHNPNLILKLVGDGLVMSSKVGNFKKYKPRYSGLLRSLDNEALGLNGCVTKDDNGRWAEVHYDGKGNRYLTYGSKEGETK